MLFINVDCTICALGLYVNSKYLYVLSLSLFSLWSFKVNKAYLKFYIQWKNSIFLGVGEGTWKMNMSQLYFIFLSGFPNHYNGAEGIHDFGDFCKYGHVRQAKGGTSAKPGTHPTLKTSKQVVLLYKKFARFTPQNLLMS